MSHWQERITRETAPAIRVEHELRYRLVRPLVERAAVWADLGCGNGLAAASALAGRLPGQVMLVDADEHAAAGARAALGLARASTSVADLTDLTALDRIGAELAGVEGERVVTCFEVVEHLRTFVPLVEWMRDLATRDCATFVLSVPNDAFWAVQNPYHASCWGEGALEELRRLLPAACTMLCQVALAGSAVTRWDPATSAASPAQHSLGVATGGEGAIATHFIAAFGARHAELWEGALAVQSDLLAQRQWERQREANLAVAEQVASEQRAALAAQERTIAEQAATLRANSAELTDWRQYIHQLEGELGRPPSGGRVEAAQPAAPERLAAPPGPPGQAEPGAAAPARGEAAAERPETAP